MSETIKNTGEIEPTTAPTKPDKKKVGALGLLKNKITVIAAIAVGIVTIVNQVPALFQGIDKIKKIPSTSEAKEPPISRNTIPDTSIAQQKCVSIKTESTSLLPHYLIPSVGGSEDFPYWLKIHADNQCEKAVYLKVSFKKGRNVASIKKNEEQQTLPISAKETKAERYYPTLDLLTPEPDEIRLSWRIESEEGVRLDENNIISRIIPPYTIDWSLKKPDAAPVNKHFLYASLSAWVRKPLPAIEEHAAGCNSEIEACYDLLFKSTQPYKVSSKTIEFPTKDTQYIRPLSKVIQSKSWVTALEAALLLATTMEIDYIPGITFEPNIVFVPETDNPFARKRVYIAWRDNYQWHGVDMQKVETTSFQENKESASAELRNLLKHENLHPQLNNKGVFFDQDESIIMVKFRKAYLKNGIQRLPEITQ